MTEIDTAGIESISLPQNISDFPISELLLTCFENAMQGYRQETSLKPCPREFTQEDGSPNLHVMIAALAHVPRAQELVNWLNQHTHDPQGQLVSWIMNTGNRWLERCPSAQINGMVDKLCKGHKSYPNHAFKINYSEESEQRYQTLGQGRSTFLAFHGSRVENFHSILRHGLHGHLNKVSAFGEGTYLSSELSVSLLYAAAANSFSGAAGPIGARVSCVALCEVIDHPDAVMRQGAGSRRARAAHQNEEIPQAYFLVTNNELIRLRYLLVFSQGQRATRRSGVSRLLCQYPVLTFCVAYVMLMLLIALVNSPVAKRYWNNLYRTKL